MRPAFRVEAACSPDQLAETIRERLRAGLEGVEGTLSSRQFTLRVPEDRRRFWTPCLDLTVGESEDPKADTSRLWGTFSPRPEIWTAFVFAIGSLVILSIFAAMFGIAQLALGRFPLALLIPLGSAVMAGLLYLAALVGQGLSIGEMYQLRAFVDDCLRQAESPVAADETAD